MIYFIEPPACGEVSGGYRYNAEVFHGLQGIEVLQVDDVSQLNLQTLAPKLLVFDSLFLRPLSKIEISFPYAVLMHYLPSSNPLLSAEEASEWRAIEDRVLEQSRFVIATGQGLADVLRQRGLTCHVCSPSVGGFLKKGNRRRFQGDGTLVVSVAAMRREKGLLESLRALAKVGFSWTWTIVAGSEDRDYADRFWAEARQLGLNERIQCVGPLSSADVRSVLQLNDLFLSSSYYESNPMAPMEALASGLPVVHSDVGDIAQMAGVEQVYVFPVGNISAATACIETACRVGRERGFEPVTGLDREWHDVRRDMQQILS